MEASKAVELLKEAMNITLQDILLFTDNPTVGIQAEYLLTVNVAKEIAKLNRYYADPYIIYLEKKTTHFARQCLPAIVWGKARLTDGLSRIQALKERQKNTRLLNFKQVDTKHRTGKIDVAIYQHPKNGQLGEQPLCAIELKSFNPSKNKIIADLERNLFFLNLKANTGDSALPYTLFGALHWNKKINRHDECKHKRSLDQKYDQILSYLKLNNPHIIFRKEIFTLSQSEGTVEIEDVDLDREAIIETLDTSTKHYFIGVIICFEKA